MHTSTYKGKRVYIKLKDGSFLVDKFVGKKARYIVLEQYGKLLKSQMVSFSIYKNKSEE